MDNKTVAITVTASAVGVGLAYLGYNKYYDVNNDIKEIREEIEGELNEKISRKEWLKLNEVATKTEPTAWSTFWSNEYKQANDEVSTNEEVDPGSIPEEKTASSRDLPVVDLPVVASHTTEGAPSTVRVPSTD